MTEPSFSTLKLWLAGGATALAVIAGVVVLVHYSSPEHPKAAKAPISQPIDPLEPPRNVQPIAVHTLAPLPVSTAPLRPDDGQGYINRRFPNQVVAEIKPLTQADQDKTIRELFPDYAKLQDDLAKEEADRAKAASAAQ